MTDLKVFIFLLVLCFESVLSQYRVPPMSLYESKSPSKPQSKGYNNKPKIWALLVAGSNTIKTLENITGPGKFYNYRHQADICHAYQVLHSHGVPDEQIIVMMYNDVAYHKENPNKGEIINNNNRQFNVYNGVPHDYTGKDVTPGNFIKILKGDVEGMRGIGSGKVIKSGPNDYVFVNYAGHGEQKLLLFPDLSFLNNKELNRNIIEMHTKGLYKKMIFYIDACQSGSMFVGDLLSNISVFAVTASDHTSKSKACCYNTEIKTHIADEFSTAWLCHSEMQNLFNATLEDQFNYIRKRVSKDSNVSKYGDQSILKIPLSEFHGKKNVGTMPCPQKGKNPVNSNDVQNDIIRMKLCEATNIDDQLNLAKELIEYIENKKFINKTFISIVEQATRNNSEMIKRIMTEYPETEFSDCYKNSIEHFIKECFSLEVGESYSYVHLFDGLCAEKTIMDHTINKAIETICNTTEVKTFIKKQQGNN